LIDVSRDGTSFGVEIQNKKTARALLMEHLDLSFTCDLGDEKINFSAVGKVVRVSFQLYSSYIVHIHFDTLLEENLIEKITGKEG